MSLPHTSAEGISDTCLSSRNWSRTSYCGGAWVGESATYFSRPTPTTMRFANSSMPALCAVIPTAVNLYSPLQHLMPGNKPQGGE